MSGCGDDAQPEGTQLWLDVDFFALTRHSTSCHLSELLSSASLVNIRAWDSNIEMNE